jgi:hypothetical protein
MSDYTPPLYDHALDQDELNRNLLWKRQRNQRMAYRAQLQARLAGDPWRARGLRDKFQPLIDHHIDINMPSLPDDPETVPPSNQGLNAS